MIRAIIIDDENRSIETLRKLLEVYCASVQIVAECNNVPSAREQIERLQPDLVFLDIAMPGKSGFDLLNELDAINFEIIFITAYNEYMLQAFRFSAIDYLLKPVDHDLLMNAVNRVEKRIRTSAGATPIEAFKHNLKNIQRPNDMKICIPNMKGFTLMKISDIIYCKADNTYTTFYFANGQSLISSRSIMEFELLLEDCSFCRIHKSYLINLAHVKEYHKGEGGMVILSNSQSLEVSRRKKDHFLNQVRGYYKF